MIINWIFWSVPVRYAKIYALWLSMIIFGFPYMLGFYYTKLGIIVNILWYDIVFYGWTKVRKKIEEDLDESDRME